MTRLGDAYILCAALVVMAVLPMLYGWAGCLAGLFFGALAFVALCKRAPEGETDW